MKLINKINLRFLVLLMMVFSLAGLVLYFAMGYVVEDNIDEILEGRAEKIKNTLKLYPNQNFTNFSPDQSVQIDSVTKGKTYQTFSDTLVFDIRENELIECRRLTFQTDINGQFYKVRIILSRFETEDMVKMIFYFMIGLFMFIGLMLFLLNKWLSVSAWQPFFKTLEQLRQFKIGSKKDIMFNNSDIYEFDQLNGVLTVLIEKIQTDFNNLKEFTENASHEIQTPLAIVKSRLETVMQNKSIPDEQNKHIQIAYKTVSRLSKLNEALLLLSKIENRQFADETEVNLCNLISEKVEMVEEMMSLKNISIELSMVTSFIVRINPYLAETLVSNLLANAIRHNYENGRISISSFEDRIIFLNTGKELELDSEKIFQRFVKHSTTNESNGLGLSIASEICKNYNLLLKYEFHNFSHNFIIYKNY